MLNVFRGIPAQLAQENKKFQISKVSRGARSRDYIRCAEWLEKAGMVLRCYALNFANLPIRGHLNSDSRKLYFHDTGLLIASPDEEAQEGLRTKRNLGVYKGALFENFIGSAPASHGYKLCYYRRENGTLEENFFVRTADILVTIEVKAGRNKSSSLRTLVSSDHYPDIKFGIKLSQNNIGFENKILNLPWFCAFSLKAALPKIGQFSNQI